MMRLLPSMACWLGTILLGLAAGQTPVDRGDRGTQASAPPGMVWIGEVLARVWSTPEPVRARIDALITNWRTTEGTTDDAVATGLAALGLEAVPYLCQVLDETRDDVPTVAILRALGTAKDPHAAGTLERVLDRPSVAERAAAVAALSRVATRNCLRGLLRALDDPSSEVWVPASVGLLTLAREDPGLNMEGSLAAHMAAAKERSRVALVLGRLHGPSARAVLLELLAEPGFEMAVLRGLWFAALPEDGNLVVQLLGSGSTAERKEVCLLLGKIGYKPAARGLIDLLHDCDRGLAANAHWALGKITNLSLAADPELWEAWWTRAGSKSAAYRAEEEVDGSAGP
ncbi:MAG: HEAT repeat domain-containing protein [Planctomycetes bacterium]|nr:HEAT repeat domain-containing protein [Planctomycetota bacterium]